MIALFFSWTIIIAVFFTFGRAFIQLWNFIPKNNLHSSFPDTLLTGMCITASVIAVFSIWIPANTMLLFALVFACILYWFCNYKVIGTIANKAIDFVAAQPRYHLLMYGVTVVSIAMFCTLHPMMTDTLYYHYQNLMWNDQYAVVPGLANLQPRLAFNSSLFLLGSTFGLKPLFGQYIFGTHTLCLALIFVWVLYKTLHSGKIIRSVIGLLMLICLFVIYKLHITSVTTDFIPNLLICYLALKVIFDREAIGKNPVLYFLLPVFIITLKISCFSIALLPFFVLFRLLKKKEYGNLALSVFGALLIVVPWCVRTVIMSGYLIFPFPYIDLFDFDWKIPIEYAIEQKEFIQSFARYPNNIDIKSVLAMPFREWIIVWWNSDMFYFNPIANKVFFILTLLSVPAGIFFLVKNRQKKEYLPIRLFWIASITGIVVWFFNAPDFRFIYSLILIQFFLVVLQIAESVKKIDFKRNFSSLPIVLATICVIFVALFSGRWVYYQRDKSVPFTNFLKVPSSIDYTRKTKGIPTNKDFVTIEINGMSINRKSLSDRDLLCFDFDLPCSNDYVGGIEMRGKTLQEGFRCKPNAEHRLTY